MNKKLFAPLAVAMILASCSSDEPVLVENNDGMVTFTAQLPSQMASRSYADGTTAKQLQYAVYEVTGDGESATYSYLSTIETPNTTFDTNLQAKVSLKLVNGKTYAVAFWAAAQNAPYSFDKNTKTVTVTTTGDSQAEIRDAFFATTEPFTVSGAIQKNVTLTRPFAQINIGTNDIDAFTAAGGSISKSGLKVSAPTTLNIIDGTVGTETAEYAFNASTLPGEGEAFPIEGYTYLTMNYVLVGTEKTTVDVTWTSDNAVPDVTFTAVPVQRNYRTNIYGSLLTNPADFTVTIDKKFDQNSPNNTEYDTDGFRIANSIEEANQFFAQGSTHVVVDGQKMTAPAAQVYSRSEAVLDVILNKAIAHQYLKIKGQATNGINVKYSDGSASVENPLFTLIVSSLPSLGINLPNATVDVKGSVSDDTAKATIGSISIESAGSVALDPESVTVPEVTNDDINKGGNIAVMSEMDEISIAENIPADLVLSIQAKVCKIQLPSSLNKPVTIEIGKDVEFPEFAFISGSTLKDLTIKGNPQSSKTFKGFVFLEQGGGAMPVTHTVHPKLFENLTLDGIHFDNGGFAPQYKVSTKNTVIRNCVFDNMKAGAVAIQHAQGGTMEDKAESITIENCTVEFADNAPTSQNGLYLLDISGSIIVKNNIVKGATAHGVFIAAGFEKDGVTIARASNIDVSGNTIQNKTRDGIKIENQINANITISNNTIAVKENGVRVKNSLDGNSLTFTGNSIDMKNAIDWDEKEGEPCGILLFNKGENAKAASIKLNGNTVTNSNGHALSLVNIVKSDDSEVQSFAE